MDNANTWINIYFANVFLLTSRKVVLAIIMCFDVRNVSQ